MRLLLEDKFRDIGFTTLGATALMVGHAGIHGLAEKFALLVLIIVADIVDAQLRAIR